MWSSHCLLFQHGRPSLFWVSIVRWTCLWGFCPCFCFLCLPAVAGASHTIMGTVMQRGHVWGLLVELGHVVEPFSRRRLCGRQKCRVGTPRSAPPGKLHSLSLSALICRVGLCPHLLSRSLADCGARRQSGVPWGRSLSPWRFMMELVADEAGIGVTAVSSPCWWDTRAPAEFVKGFRGKFSLYLLSAKGTGLQDSLESAAVCWVSFPGLQRPLLTWKCFCSFFFFFFFWPARF